MKITGQNLTNADVSERNARFSSESTRDLRLTRNFENESEYGEDCDYDFFGDQESNGEILEAVTQFNSRLDLSSDLPSTGNNRRFVKQNG
ncbi:MAG: hypothetical protein C5B47_00265 [Verrucomicrobia bacterium]|nr:MAG: hypothetical protein C5B47_00265 [Verrucomicrobiota bacterium]